jgi:hypothetical protein
MPKHREWHIVSSECAIFGTACMYKRDKEIKYSSDFQEYKQIIKSKKDHYRKSVQNVSEKTTKLFHGSNGFRIKK